MSQHYRTFIALALAGLAVVHASPAWAQLVINEIDYDQPSTDTAEFVELMNAGDVAVDLSGVEVVMVNGANAGFSEYRRFALPAVDLAPGGYFVLWGDAANVTPCDFDVSPDSNLIQNGEPDALYLEDVATGARIDTVSYEGVTADPLGGEGGTSLADSGSIDNASLSRCPDGADTDDNQVDFALIASTVATRDAWVTRYPR